MSNFSDRTDDAAVVLSTGINVTDIDRSVSFYTEVFGLVEVNRYQSPGVTEVILRTPGQLLGRSSFWPAAFTEATTRLSSIVSAGWCSGFATPCSCGNGPSLVEAVPNGNPRPGRKESLSGLSGIRTASCWNSSR